MYTREGRIYERKNGQVIGIIKWNGLAITDEKTFTSTEDALAWMADEAGIKSNDVPVFNVE